MGDFPVLKLYSKKGFYRRIHLRLNQSFRHTYNIIKALPYGTHFCQFYRNKSDLLEVLIPYFKVGLQKNELCLCICAEPLKAKEARAALAKAVKSLPSRIKRGQIEFIDAADWYDSVTEFDIDRQIRQTREKHNRARREGFFGLRFLRNVTWLKESGWSEFIDYENKFNERLAGLHSVVLCCYPSDVFNTAELIGAVNSHPLALVRRAGRWELSQNTKIGHDHATIRADKAILRSFKKELRTISRRLLSVREEEKKNLSVSLHNSTGTMAVSIGSHLAAIRDHLANGRPAAALEILNQTQAAVIAEIRMMKRMAIDLRPPDLDEMSLAEALAAYFSDLSGRHHIPIDFRNELSPAGRADGNPSENTAIALYRIAQEAVVNAIRHAQAKTISVRLSHALDDIELRIADDGRGFNPRRRPKKGNEHLGLTAMRELAVSAGGTLRVVSSPGKGTTLMATIPLPAKASP